MREPLGASFEQACFGSKVPSHVLPALRENSFFYGVSRSLIDDSAAAFRMAHLPSSTILYSRKSVSTSIFLILDGAVQIGYPLVAKKPATAILHSGRFTGEASLIADAEALHKVTATCVGPTLLCWARAVDIIALLEREPQIALNVAHSLHARVADTLTALDEFIIG